jgi:hypothetical protein
MELWLIRKMDDEREPDFSGREVASGTGFVLHRHRDEDGEHLDLRLEDGEVLVGWRLPRDGSERLADGEELICELKRMHPRKWLDVNDDECFVEDAGTYRWLERSADRGVGVFFGERFAGRYSFTKRQLNEESASERYEKPVSLIKKELGLDLGRAEDAEKVLARFRDGETARKRAVERLCALGRELDGDSFDEKMWRSTLSHLVLTEIHGHLRSFERRFDEKHPPVPVTKREKLESDKRVRERLAAGIVSEEFSVFG